MSADRISTVSVVIPTLRGGDRLAPTIERLQRDASVGEIVLVDDRSDAMEPLLPAVPSLVRIVCTCGAVGPNRARQAGVERARGEIVLLLDDDVVPAEGLAARHATRHSKPGLVVVGYMPVPAPERPGAESLPRLLYRREYEKRVSGYERDPATILTHLWGGNMSLRRVDALRVGIANPGFVGRRHEDREFGIRCARAGLVGVFDRALGANHEYERSLEPFLADARVQGSELVALGRLHPEAMDGARWSPGWADCIAHRCEPAAARALLAGVRLAGASQRHGVELMLLKAARRIVRAAGAREAWRAGQ